MTIIFTCPHIYPRVCLSVRVCVNGKFPPFDIWSNLSKGISQPFVKVKHRNMEIYGAFLIKRLVAMAFMGEEMSTGLRNGS